MSDLTGVVAMTHGSATALDEPSVRDYLGRIMRGRVPTAAQVADLQRRYETIGGPGHLLRHSRAQVAQLQSELGPEFVVALGSKFSTPFVADAVDELAKAGARRVVGIALAPHESALTTSDYDRVGSEAASAAGLGWAMVRGWHLAPDLIALWSDLLADALAQVAAPARVLFSAHSLPARAAGPYQEQVSATAAAVAARAELPDDCWEVVFQSVPPGVDPSTWLGPNLADSYPRGGRVVVAPIGFVSDHLEILYDLDVQAKEEARQLGAELTRTRLPNSEPRLASAMAAAIAAAA